MLRVGDGWRGPHPGWGAAVSRRGERGGLSAGATGTRRVPSALMRVWVDMTASAQPLVFRPLIALMRAQGHEVEITTRDYAQTIQLIEREGLEAEVIGHHGGRSRLGK